MKILFVADWKSTLARSWIRACVSNGHEVAVFDSRTSRILGHGELHASSVQGVPEVQVSDVTMPHSQRVLGKDVAKRGRTALKRAILESSLDGKALGRAHISMQLVRTGGSARRLSRAFRSVDFDVIHALRIPFEGVIAQKARPNVPLIVSIWGNDLTFIARLTKRMEVETRRTLRYANALHADCRRDVGLASSWGFDPALPSLVVPSAGGLDNHLFALKKASAGCVRSEWKIRPESIIFINPRGLRSYVDNDIFVSAAIRIAQRHPACVFIGVGLREDPRYQKWVYRAGVHEQVILTKPLPQRELFELFAESDYYVSPTWHDGTPNSLLESMAIGLIPVCSRLPSIHEWLTHQENAVMFDMDVTSLVGALEQCLTTSALWRREAVRTNRSLVMERAAADAVADRLEAFYSETVRNPR